MKLEMIAIRDEAVKAYMTPFFVRALGEATRMFRHQANDPESKIANHPEDFLMYHLGTYDDETGIIHQNERHVLLGMASEFIDVPEEPTYAPS